MAAPTHSQSLMSPLPLSLSSLGWAGTHCAAGGSQPNPPLAGQVAADAQRVGLEPGPDNSHNYSSLLALFWDDVMSFPGVTGAW